MQRLTRLFKHRLWDQTDAQRVMPEAAMQRLTQRVAISEARQSGEIRVCIEAGLPLSCLWQKHHARQRAISLFGELGVWDTEANNGVLIYLLLAEHAIEIIADRGLNTHVSQARWEVIIASLRESLRARQFEQGLETAIDAVDGLLRLHFPLAEGAANPNELPDAVVLL